MKPSSVETTFLTFFAEDFIHKVRENLAKIEAGQSQTMPPWEESKWRDLTFQILQDLTQTLQQQAQKALDQGGTFGDQQYQTLQYALAAYADDVFLRCTWPGRILWEDHLLEMSFFNTHQSGERFFQEIDTLIQQGNRASLEMARIYMWILSLGFKGQYVHEPSIETDQHHLNDYHARLCLLLNPSQGASLKPYLFPQSYQHTMDRGDHVMLPDPGVWKVVYGAFLSILLCIGIYTWWITVIPLRAQLQPLAKLMEGI